MNTRRSLDLDSTLVRPLGLAQNEFLQVLLSSFQVRRDASGLTLDVEFGFDTPAIWLRKGKAHVQDQLLRDAGKINRCVRHRE
jgi:hypothetical protein